MYMYVRCVDLDPFWIRATLDGQYERIVTKFNVFNCFILSIGNETVHDLLLVQITCMHDIIRKQNSL